MAKVEFSNGIKKHIANATLNSLINTDYNSGYTDRIRFMKGSQPTSYSQYSNFINFRASDVLVDWNHLATVTNDSISTTAAAASQNGVVSWFICFRDGQSSGYPAVVGTVGLTGSGADIELDNVNIVQGTTYSISNLRILFPTIFTYGPETTTTTAAPTTQAPTSSPTTTTTASPTPAPSTSAAPTTTTTAAPFNEITTTTAAPTTTTTTAEPTTTTTTAAPTPTTTSTPSTSNEPVYGGDSGGDAGGGDGGGYDAGGA